MELSNKTIEIEFNAEFYNILSDLVDSSEFQDLSVSNKWLERVLLYNVKQGKKNRAFYFIHAYNLIKINPTDENIKESYIVGWAMEILQAAALIVDDMMDNSETRRGKPCWYKVDNVNTIAINDAFFMESCVYVVLKKHLKGKEYYHDIIELIRDTTHKTLYGQNLDTLTSMDKNFESYTMDLYKTIVKYKTSYYSFTMPIILAFTMTGMKDEEIIKETFSITLEIGLLFQIQDDYLDCYGNDKITGKIGTDIADGKCSWLFVKACEEGNEEEKKILLENYGLDDKMKIMKVKKLYEKLGIQKLYLTYEENTFNSIFNRIDDLDEKYPKEIYYNMLHKIHRREK